MAHLNYTVKAAIPGIGSPFLRSNKSACTKNRDEGWALHVSQIVQLNASDKY